MLTAKASNSAGAGQAEGLLLVDKPAGITSHDAVQIVRRVYRQHSIGHLGTLDPFATGLLVMLLGRFTRLATFVDADPKVYQATIQFGTGTNTDDLTGAITRTASIPDRSAVLNAVAALTGSIEQLPPAFSAKQIEGKRAYVSARRGEELELKPAWVTVFEWKNAAYDAGELSAEISCSAGTYIRSLARDLGHLAGSAAHLKSLRRIRSGNFAVADAATLEQITGNPPRPMTLRVVPEPG